MGAVFNDLEKGGGKTKSVRDVIKGSGTGSTSLWVGDVGDEPPHVRGHWGFQHRVSIWITGSYRLRFLDGSR